jgi:DNA-directed RNA polymerase subunit E'/Rpb7
MSLFSNVVTVDKIVLHPNQYSSNDINTIIIKKLRKKVEGKCTRHGFIKPFSSEIVKKSAGRILDMSFNGHVSYNVTFKAQLCNPEIDSIIKCKIVNTNNFGILAESSININGNDIVIIEAIVVKGPAEQEYKIGDIIYIQIKGKKFDLNDTKITVHGIVDVNQKEILKNKDNAVDDNEEIENYDDDDDESYQEEDDDDENVAAVGDEDEDEDEDEDVEEDLKDGAKKGGNVVNLIDDDGEGSVYDDELDSECGGTTSDDGED